MLENEFFVCFFYLSFSHFFKDNVLLTRFLLYSFDSQTACEGLSASSWGTGNGSGTPVTVRLPEWSFGPVHLHAD